MTIKIPNIDFLNLQIEQLFIINKNKNENVILKIVSIFLINL